MSRHVAPPIGIRDVLRWWPLVVLPAILAVAAALWSVSHQQPSYTAATRLIVVPLAQWDETFLGTSLVRDGGDAKTTATTIAELLNSPKSAAVAAEHLGDEWNPQSVDAAVDAAVVPESNVIEIKARSTDPRVAERLSEEFAKATLAQRWQTIAAELDARIAALAATTAADPNAGEASTRLQTLTIIRQAGADPTLRIDSTARAVEDDRLPVAMVVGLAAVGGAAVGLLCAMGAARLRWQRPTRTSKPAPEAEPAESYSSDGSG